MNLQQLNPWNWFKDEDSPESSSVPIKRNNTNNSALTDSSESTHPFVQLQRNIDQLFDDAFQGVGLLSRGRSSTGLTSAFQAKVNIASDEKNYHISLAVPGLTEKDVSLDLYKGTLTIRGEKKESTETKDRQYYRREHSYGSFQRVLSLPEDANEESIVANIKNGVLEITLARKALPQRDVKRIPINS